MSSCIHCDQEVVTPFYAQEINNSQIGPFCCRGCITVYHVIKDKGLNEYYEIKKNVALFKKRAPAEESQSEFTFLDTEEFLKEYSYKNQVNDITMEFYLEGIHCLACLWIIEKLNEFVPGVKSSKLNMGRSVVTISLQENGKFSQAAKELDKIGYKPHALKINQSEQTLKVSENRKSLLRIGIAGAAAGNVMMYAISLYAGAGPEYQGAFNLLTVLFAIPAMTYSAWPFYQSSYIALKNKTLSIDVPIAMSLIMGLIMGLYNLAIGVHDNYFDSLTALVFLLLLSRYFLKIIQEKGLSTNDLNFFYQGESVLKVINVETLETKEIHPKFIVKNDLLKVAPNQMIPADGILYKGESYLDHSLLTGESDLIKKKVGDQLFSGTLNVSNDLILEVTNTDQHSRLGKILKQVESGWTQKAKIIDITNRISVYFVIAVFTLSLLLFIKEYMYGSIPHALEKALTLLIVTCPCALAIATPLTFIRSLSKSAEKGIIIKDDAVLEKLAQAKTIFLDKTGTITESKLQMSTIVTHKNAIHSLATIVLNLEKNSKHPVANALKNHFASQPYEDMSLTDFKEISGIGVSGFINNHFYEIKKNQIFEDQQLIASFSVKNFIKKDAAKMLSHLKSLGLKIKILSGDTKENVELIAQQLNLSPEEYSFGLSPEEKMNVIKNTPHSIMVGDGANDAIALACASTGIAVHGAMDISLRAADIYLSTPGLNAISDLIITGRETMNVIYRNLALSLSYNSISVLLAYTGYISPLTAAIVMPVSSLTVLFSTLIGTKHLRTLWK
jgi:heavy metal translocating P-type ATPase